VGVCDISKKEALLIMLNYGSFDVYFNETPFYYEFAEVISETLVTYLENNYDEIDGAEEFSFMVGDTSYLRQCSEFSVKTSSQRNDGTVQLSVEANLTASA
jgi:hypothetical protein